MSANVNATAGEAPPEWLAEASEADKLAQSQLREEARDEAELSPNPTLTPTLTNPNLTL